MAFLDIAFENLDVMRVSIEQVERFSINTSGDYHYYYEGRPDIKRVFRTDDVKLVLHKSAKDIEPAHEYGTKLTLLSRLLAWKDISGITFIYDDGSYIEYEVPYCGINWHYNNHFQKIECDNKYIYISIGKEYVKFPLFGYLKDLFIVKIIAPIRSAHRKARWKKSI